MAKYKRLHRVLGLVLIAVTILASISGIVLNHRSLFSGVDLPRSVLSEGYSYNNGRQAALRGSVKDDAGVEYLFGDAGVWQKTGHTIAEYNQGFAFGADNHKVYDVLWFNGKLVAATHFGLFTRTSQNEGWARVESMKKVRYVDLFYKDESLVALSRNAAFITGDMLSFEEIDLPAPKDYEQKSSLFTFLWNLHSGEIVGFVGKLFVDLLGLILIALAVTGFVRFYLPRRLKGRKKKSGVLRLFQKNRQIHRYVGISCGLFLGIIVVTGMFLRPPLLIPIAGIDVAVIAGTHLDQDNPWYDKLRKGLWDNESESFVFATKDGVYALHNDAIKKFSTQPPVSVMGCTVLQSLGGSEYLVGSFSGLFLWHSTTGEVRNAVTGNLHQAQIGGRPISENMITGLVGDKDYYYIDYRRGMVPLFGQPEKITLPPSFVSDAKMSLWNFSLEVHTGRIFESLLGILYILYVPISGLMFLVVIGTGYWWYVRPKFRKKK